MYRIMIITDKEKKEQRYEDRMMRFCTKKNIFPQIETFRNQERFFACAGTVMPTSALVAIAGVEGLNVVEHLRSLYPECGIIWCSDLDFSVHAFRLRVDYFLKEPVDDERFEEGLLVWYEKRKAAEIPR